MVVNRVLNIKSFYKELKFLIMWCVEEYCDMHQNTCLVVWLYCEQLSNSLAH